LTVIEVVLDVGVKTEIFAGQLLKVGRTVSPAQAFFTITLNVHELDTPAPLLAV
jgi:hypothetical protein